MQVQLWHNNRGRSPGWYIKRVTVRDVDTGQSFYFLCERWLAVEESDGKVEREFMALDSQFGFSVVSLCLHMLHPVRLVNILFCKLIEFLHCYSTCSRDLSGMNFGLFLVIYRVIHALGFQVK